jgi:hypothetical protein
MLRCSDVSYWTIADTRQLQIQSCMAKTLTPEKPSYYSRAIAKVRRHFSSESLNALTPMWI